MGLPLRSWNERQDPAEAVWKTPMDDFLGGAWTLACIGAGRCRLFYTVGFWTSRQFDSSSRVFTQPRPEVVCWTS